MNLSNCGGELGSLGETGLSRRDAIVRLVTLAAGTSLFGHPSFAQEPAEGTRFDLHHHFFPPVAKKLYALKALVGPLQIVFGSDFPFMPTLDTVEGLRRCGFTSEELHGIEYENALRILAAREPR